MDSERIFLEGSQERLLKWLAVGLISLVAFETLAVATAMPTVVRSLEGANLYALAMGITMATQLIATALAGPWSDNRMGCDDVLGHSLGGVSENECYV